MFTKFKTDQKGFTLLDAVITAALVIALIVGGFMLYKDVVLRGKIATTEAAAQQVFDGAMVYKTDGREIQTAADEYNETTKAVKATVQDAERGVCATAEWVRDDAEVTAQRGFCDESENENAGGNETPAKKAFLSMTMNPLTEAEKHFDGVNTLYYCIEDACDQFSPTYNSLIFRKPFAVNRSLDSIPEQVTVKGEWVYSDPLRNTVTREWTYTAEDFVQKEDGSWQLDITLNYEK